MLTGDKLVSVLFGGPQTYHLMIRTTVNPAYHPKSCTTSLRHTVHIWCLLMLREWTMNKIIMITLVVMVMMVVMVNVVMRTEEIVLAVLAV